MTWDDFMAALNQIVMRYYASMNKGSYMSVLMGDVRRGGFHSMLNDIVKPGEMQQLIIKQQHNFKSARRSYSGSNFIPIEHEYIMVLKKPNLMTIMFQWPRKYEMDVRDSKCATWSDVIYGVMKSNGGKMDLDALYEQIDGHKKCAKNKNWQAKIRQTLQINKRFEPVKRGVWQLVRA